MGYIEDIRSKVGNDPIILNSAGAIILDSGSGVLLQYRNDTMNWGLPGGYMEPGETFEETIRRELKEEMGIHPDNLAYFDIFSGKDLYHVYPNGDQVYSVAAVYIAYGDQGEIQLDHKEISKAAYFSLDGLPKEITKTTKIILDHFRDKIKTRNNIQFH